MKTPQGLKNRNLIFSEKIFQKTPVLALKSPTSAHFMSFSIKFTISFSISKNAFIDEYIEFSDRVYTHPNKRSQKPGQPLSIGQASKRSD
jgi:hypothetical protein